MEGGGSGAYFNRDWYDNGVVLYPKGTDIDWVSFKPSATNNWKDSTTATGGIRTFQKIFAYKSGFKI